jgi:hypothetical protein
MPPRTRMRLPRVASICNDTFVLVPRVAATPRLGPSNQATPRLRRRLVAFSAVARVSGAPHSLAELGPAKKATGAN